MTDIVVGNNEIKAVTMSILGKRRWKDNSDDPFDGEYSDAEKEVLNRKLKYQRLTMKDLNKEIRNLKLQIDVKDYEVKE